MLARPSRLAICWRRKGRRTSLSAVDTITSSPSRRHGQKPTAAFAVSHFSSTIWRSEEHTSELQSQMRKSYAVFCWQKKDSKIQHKRAARITTQTHDIIS